MYKNAVLVILAAGLVVVSCSGGKKVSMYPEERLALADSLRSEDKCSKAVSEYEQVLSEFPSQRIAEQAQYNLGKCYMDMGEHDLAIEEFEDFVDSYVRSDLVDNALYLIALSYLEQSPRPERDQTKTSKALSELHLLLREYPDTDVRDEAEQAIAACRSKLAEKEYLSGRLYLRMKQWGPAHIYFNSVLKEYQDTPWAARALLGRAAAYVGQKRLNKARETFEQVVTDYPDSDVSQEASQRLKELGRAIESESQTSSEE